MRRKRAIAALVAGTSFLCSIAPGTTRGDGAFDLAATQAQLLSSSLDLSGLPKGFAAARPVISEVSAQRRGQGAVWAVTIKLVGPDRLPQGAKISGNTSNLKIESQVTFTAYRDEVAAERDGIRLVKEMDPGVEFGSSSGIHGFLRCKFSAIQTNCVRLDDKLPVIVETQTDNWIGASMESDELSRLRDELDQPLMDTALRQLAAIVPPAAAKKPWEGASSSGKTPPSVQKAADGTVWNSFSALSQAPAASSPAAEEAWQNSWDAFAREVQALYARNATPAEFARRFNGRRVTWEGVIDLMDTIDHLDQVGMPILMPKKIIRLPDGQTCPLDRLQLSFGNDVRVPVDETFRFRATLDRGRAPAVLVGTWPGQKTRAIIVKTNAQGELIK